MNINVTLLFQMLTFMGFIVFTMKLVWPLLETALSERQKSIAEGLAAAERGKLELELAQKKVTEQLREIKVQSAEILDRANKQAHHAIEEAKLKAQEEGARLLASAKSDIEQSILRAKESLKEEIAHLAVLGAQRILKKEIDAKANSDLLDNLIKELDKK